MIEKNIWQTYKNKYTDNADYINFCTNTWIHKNNNWNYNYLDDSDIEDFISDGFGNKWLDSINKKCHTPVMKIDIWRLMCVYLHGGIYSDIDTICTESIDLWINQYADKSFIFGYQNDDKIGQWCFLSESNHPVIEKILNNIDQKLYSCDMKIDSVHDVTGVNIFTDTILENVNIDKNNNLLNQNIRINNSRKFLLNKMHLIEDPSFFSSGKVVHLIASKFWKFDDYKSWNDVDSTIKNKMDNK